MFIVCIFQILNIVLQMTECQWFCFHLPYIKVVFLAFHLTWLLQCYCSKRVRVHFAVPWHSTVCWCREDCV